ncbi:uncharacterized protein EAF02_011793 [Botrytis sinoallii]|uniref:uncharacterized protein n=1 Tax=Botrytis sinoallii TaxID=1463999 RepID=UPI0019004EA2|nr:uncharacterized protein EAF02_011793 [Botrytis sinoallii]KAF7853803.1 hypothetical protein EAF02_011793 [Botrytis sinoallii]
MKIEKLDCCWIKFCFDFARESPEPPERPAPAPTTATATATATAMWIIADLVLLFACAAFPSLLIGASKEWVFIRHLQLFLSIFLFGLNIVVFAHHPSVLVEQMIAADLVYFLLGSLAQVAFWALECRRYDSKDAAWFFFGATLAINVFGLANTGMSIRKNGMTPANRWPLPVGLAGLIIPTMFTLYDFFKPKTWCRTMRSWKKKTPDPEEAKKD